MVDSPIATADGRPEFVRDRADDLVRRSRSTAYKLLLYGLLVVVAVQFVRSGGIDATLLATVALAYGVDVALQLYYQWEDRR